jgi:four helix bundle protein
MDDVAKKFKTFEDLLVYQEARQFRKKMYGVTRMLPIFEKFELASQIRRASVSLTNNIAEGHGRYHYLDQIKFLLQARGSLEELLDDLNICADEKYVPDPQLAGLKAQGWKVFQLLNGYMRSLRERRKNDPLVLRDRPLESDDVLGDEASEPDSTIQPFNDSTS